MRLIDADALIKWLHDVDVANMTTYNSVPKDSLVRMARYLLDFIVDGDWRDRK